jgi:hypothetical protein
MQENLHVPFGEGDEETCPGNGVKRFIPTQRAPHQAGSMPAGAGHAARALGWGCLACIQSAACRALPAAVKMARGSSFRTRSCEATQVARSGRG